MANRTGMASVDALIDKYGYWGEHPEYPVEEWRNEVANGDTKKGYWEWVYAQTSDEEV